MLPTRSKTWILDLLIGSLAIGCTGGGEEQATCEQRASQFVTELRSEVFSALVTGEDIDLHDLEPLREEDVSGCAEGELQDLLAVGVNVLLEEVYVSEAFAEANVASRHTVGNQLAILVLALNDELPTPAPT
jgi:hypothetical protein